MNKRLGAAFAILLTLALLAAAGCSKTQSTTLTTPHVVEEFPICTSLYKQIWPDVSGNIVVWEDWRNARRTPFDNADIYGYNILTGAEFPICNNSAAQRDPRISGDIVVWTDNRNGGWSNWDIYGYNLTSGTEFAICTAESNQASPAVSGDIVVWRDERNGNRDIYAYDLSTSTEFPVCTSPDNQLPPDISGDIVVGYDSIYGYNLSTHTEFLIGSHLGCDVRVSGDTVVWTERDSLGDSVAGYQISAGRDFVAFEGRALYWEEPDISGNIVVSAGYENPEANLSEREIGIYGYNINTQEEFAICTNQTNAQAAPAISGNIVVWADGRDRYHEWDIYGARLSFE
jgi:beta propeller repeat protein